MIRNHSPPRKGEIRSPSPQAAVQEPSITAKDLRRSLMEQPSVSQETWIESAASRGEKLIRVSVDLEKHGAQHHAGPGYLSIH